MPDTQGSAGLLLSRLSWRDPLQAKGPKLARKWQARRPATETKTGQERGFAMIYKRGKWWWMDDMVNSARYREPLGAKDWREAQSLEKERIAQLARKAPDPTKISQSYGSMTITAAAAAYGEERRLQGSPRS